MKKSLILALTLLARLGAAAGQEVVLYGNDKPEMYKYAFPEGASTVLSQEQGKARQLVFSLKADASAGGGIGVDKLSLKGMLANGALELYVRGAKGGEKVDVGFVQAKGMSPQELAFQVLLPLSNYGTIGTSWTKITIPLKDFPAQGGRWVESEKRRVTGPFNWDRVSEFVVAREAAGTGKETVAFANIKVVGAYNAAAVAAAKPKLGQARGPVVLFDDKYSAEAGGSYAYPTGQAMVEVTGGGRSGQALKVSLPTNAWSGAGIYRSPLDYSAFRAKGVIELWAKGVKGGEDFNVGLLEKTNGSSSKVAISKYLPGGLKTSWQRIQVPLRDLPAQGSKWDEKAGKNASFDFDWTKVGELVLDNNGANHDNGVLFLDDVVIKPAP